MGERKRAGFQVKFIFISLFFVAGIIIVVNFARIFRTAEYFKLKEIILSESNRLNEMQIINPQINQGVSLSYLKGKNIFGIDLKRESQVILNAYPNFLKVRLVRILPDRLFVYLLRRTPVAGIKLYRYFFVDEEGVLLDTFAEPQDLPLITGVETKIFSPRSGKKYNLLELKLALSIIKELKGNVRLKDYKIKRVDVSRQDSASFFLADGLEIKLGEINIKDKIEMLPSLLIQLKNDFANIKYVDLRFNDPVIKFKEIPKQ